MKRPTMCMILRLTPAIILTILILAAVLMNAACAKEAPNVENNEFGNEGISAVESERNELRAFMVESCSERYLIGKGKCDMANGDVINEGWFASESLSLSERILKDGSEYGSEYEISYWPTDKREGSKKKYRGKLTLYPSKMELVVYKLLGGWNNDEEMGYFRYLVERVKEKVRGEKLGAVCTCSSASYVPEMMLADLLVQVHTSGWHRAVFYIAGFLLAWVIVHHVKAVALKIVHYVKAVALMLKRTPDQDRCQRTERQLM